MLNKINNGFKEFILKSVIFVLVLLFIRVIIRFLFLDKDLYKSTILPEKFLPYFKGDLFVAGIFVGLAFIIYERERILQLKKYPFKLKHSILFSILTLISLVIYYFTRYIINQNIAFYYNNYYIAFILLTLTTFMFVGFLIINVYGLFFVKDFLIKFYRSLILFLCLGVLFYFSFLAFQQLWVYFSAFITKILFYIFKITHNDVFMYLDNLNGPILGVGDFVVSIGKPCSGIESMLLFTSLYLIIFLIDRNKINKKNMLILFIPGLIGIFIFNILRIYLLMLVGVHYNPQFAVGLFHQNVGWILFLIYFGFFYFFFSKIIYIKGR